MQKPINKASDMVLETHRVAKRYGQNRYIISGLDHSFSPGSGTGLVGPNGSGKTTFFRLLSATAFPTDGSIHFGGLNIHKQVHEYLNYVGIVSDVSELPQFLSAVELVEGVMRARGLWTQTSEQELHELFEELELDERRETLIGTYSSGMQQKVMIATALSLKPKILLLDEPFRALDVSATEAVMRKVLSFKQDGGIVVVSSHQQEHLDFLCDSFIEFPYVK